MPFLNYISYYLPANVLTNEDLANDFGDWTPDKIKNKTGISSRHIVNQETIIDLAVSATNKLLIENQIDKNNSSKDKLITKA
jgi:3-oxoacyl-[acyl-carrier-protein] synthase-3